jgi:hypothetical protein
MRGAGSPSEVASRVNPGGAGRLTSDDDTAVHAGIVERRPISSGLTGRDRIGRPGGRCQRSEIRGRIEPTAFDHDLGEDERYCDARE